MPETAEFGLPYPLGTAPNNVPGDLQALADRLEAVLSNLKSGSESIALTANTAADVTVTFDAAFDDIPNVVVVPRVNGSDPTLYNAIVKTKSSSGAVFRVVSTTTATRDFDWIAHLPTA